MQNMNAEARASLRHYLSAALMFDKGNAYDRTLAAFDEWFRLQDSRAEWPFPADATHPGMKAPSFDKFVDSLTAELIATPDAEILEGVNVANVEARKARTLRAASARVAADLAYAAMLNLFYEYALRGGEDDDLLPYDQQPPRIKQAWDVIRARAALSSQSDAPTDTQRLDWLLPNLHPANFGLDYDAEKLDEDYCAEWRAAIDRDLSSQSEAR